MSHASKHCLRLIGLTETKVILQISLDVTNVYDYSKTLTLIFFDKKRLMNVLIFDLNICILKVKQKK